MTISSPISNEQKLLSRLESAVDAVKTGDKEQAILHLKQLLDSEPRHELANGMLASVYAELGLHDLAAYYFQELLKHHPENMLARFQLGTLLLTKGNFQQAVDALQPMLSLPDDFLAHFHSGLALHSLQQRAAAHGLFRQAAGRMPSDHPLQEHLQTMLKATE